MSTSATTVYEDPAVRRAAADTVRPGGLVLTDHAIALAAPPRSAVTLDVGCGAGVTVEHLVERHGLRGVGVDPSALLVTAGRARRPDLALLRARAEGLPFVDGSVDVVLAECVLSVTDDPSAALAEFARVLRPSGRLVLADLYARDAAGAADLGDLPAGSCLRGAVGRDEVLARLAAAEFRVRRWEDHSEALARLAVQLLWEDGSTARLWCPKPADGSAPDPSTLRAAIRRSRPGYFLLIAESRGR